MDDPWGFCIYQVRKPLDILNTTKLDRGWGMYNFQLIESAPAAIVRNRPAPTYTKPSHPVTTTHELPSVPPQFPVAHHGGSNYKPKSVRSVPFPLSITLS